MTGTTVSNDEFFERLAQLFDYRRAQDHGSIFLVQKRLSYGQDLPEPSSENPHPDGFPSKPLPILIRVSNGKSKKSKSKKIKLSTIVDPSSLDSFYARYADICKAGMVALKPRDRSKKKAKARKKKVGTAAGGAIA